MRTSRRGSLKSVAWPLIATLSVPAAHAQVLPNESAVVLQPDFVDPEYSQARAEVTWVDKNGSLWVANVDLNTGLFKPSDGKGTLVDADAMKTADIKTIGNGPEWVGTASGDQIVYTKFVSGQPHTAANARLALAQLSGGGWSFRMLSPNQQRNAPFASLNEGDPEPTISYMDPRGNHYWRNLYDAKSETKVTQDPRSLKYPLRFAQGVRAAAFVAPVAGVSQVFIYWLDTKEADQITFDSGQKGQQGRPFIWQAPEYGGDLVMKTVVDDNEIRIYHLPAGGSNTDWEVIDSISTPGQGVINSPEPFTYNGKSYVFFAANVPPLSYPSAIFLSGIDAGHPSLQQLTPDQPTRARTDPEVFIANDGPYIYYNRGTDGSGQTACNLCNEGIFRTYTGLAPAQ